MRSIVIIFELAIQKYNLLFNIVVNRMKWSNLYYNDLKIKIYLKNVNILILIQEMNYYELCYLNIVIYINFAKIA